ncbi:MAG: hypothetical protein ACKN9E_02260 [Microcystaceae cyanobacterium]
MGAAKRRKQHDPNYGNPWAENGRAQRWYEQMLKELPSFCLPDMGHHLYREKSMTVTLVIDHRCFLLPDEMGLQVTVRTKTECVSILFPKEEALKMVKERLLPKETERFIMELGDDQVKIEGKLRPDLRFRVANGEWILPLEGKVLEPPAVLFDMPSGPTYHIYCGPE